MADFAKNVEEMVGRLEKRRVATESTRDETGDKTAATAGDERYGGDRWGNVCGRRSVYNRRPPSLFGEHSKILRWQTLKKLKRWWGRLEKRRMATESGGDETCDKTAGDERDGGDRWGNVYGRRGVRI